MGKKLQGQVKELTAGVAEAELGRDEARASAGAADAKANELGVAVDEGKVALTQSDRARKLAESEKNENTDRLVELQALYTAAANGKRKADDDFHALHEEMEELENAAQAGTEKAAKAAVDVGRLAADLASANAATANAENRVESSRSRWPIYNYNWKKSSRAAVAVSNPRSEASSSKSWSSKATSTRKRAERPTC